MANQIVLSSDEAMIYLRKEVQGLAAPVRHLCDYVLNDPAFRTSPGGSKHHHNYPGGLLQHTYEVMSHAKFITGDFRFVRRGLLVPAIIWHDYHKTRDYRTVTVCALCGAEYGTPAWVGPCAKAAPEKVQVHAGIDKIIRTEYLQLIGHVTGSAMACQQEMLRLQFDQATIEDMLHVMLAHHGRRDWGSPVEPKMPEAWILHAADMLSAQPLAEG